jgi:hypothetical protein
VDFKQMDISNLKFNLLKPVEILDPDPIYHNTRWKCVCDCGNIKTLEATRVANGVIKSCGCLLRKKKFTDLTGQKFGKLLVTGLSYKEIKKNYNHHYWNCSCECGNNVIVLQIHLLRYFRPTTSCGCYVEPIDYSKCKDKNRSTMLKQYIKDAKDRGHEWKLTNEQTYKLFESNCYYCNSQPSSVRCDSFITNYIFNGIDRINNNLGYLPDNVVTCCKHCNFAKRDRDYQEFIEWGKRLGLNLLNKDQEKSN